MTDRPLVTCRMILHAAARVLGCGSAQMAIMDEERSSLVIRMSVSGRELKRLAAVEQVLGFTLEGARLPLAVTESLLVRAFREGRLIISHDVGELAGGLISAEAGRSIRATIGPRTFAVVPIAGRLGAIGVLLFEKEGEAGFSADDRDLLLAYSDRVGADLASQALTDEVQQLESPTSSTAGAPVVYACSSTLEILAGPQAGLPLWQGIDVEGEPLRDAAVRLADGGTSLVLRQTSTGKTIRLTLARGVGDSLVAVAEDLEEGERLRREAARAREHLAKVLRSVADAILTLDVDGQIASGNEAVERALGFRPDELRGQHALRLCSDERSQRRAVELSREVRSSGFAEAELRLRRKDGSSFAAEVSALLLADDEESAVGVVWRVHDLTERRRGDAERKRLRARLLHSERLSALGEMAARIAHEVRNPLVSIGAAAQVVAEELGEASPVAGEVQAIAREVRRLDAIVSDFLRFARPRRTERRPVDLASVLAETVDLVRNKVSNHELRLAVDGPCHALCDPDGIKQVLLNVLLNAVESSAAGIVDCEARVHGDRVVLSVADRGPGIPEAMRRRAFDPFVSSKTRGTGLGLAISKQIIEEHRGRIRLLSRRSGGTRVVIELPVG